MGMTAAFRVVDDAVVEAWIEDPENVEDPLGDVYSPDPDVLDIDKAWHGIHWLLVGEAGLDDGDDPLAFVLGGGTPVGEDLSYGPARAFTAAEVRAIAEALRPLTADVLRQRFDGDAMSSDGVYPDIWQRDPEEDDTLGYLLSYYEDLRKLVLDAASSGKGLVTAIL